MLPPEHFDAHNVVTFQLCIPDASMRSYRLPMPQTWIDLPIDQQFITPAYDEVIPAFGVPDSGDNALKVQWTMLTAVPSRPTRRVPWSQTRPLPKQYRGRCQPRRFQLGPRCLLTKPARPGDYAHGGNHPQGHAMQHQAGASSASPSSPCLQAQTHSPSDRQQYDVQQEWLAILRCKAFDGCQVKCWCNTRQSWDLPPMQVPQVDYLGTMLGSSRGTKLTLMLLWTVRSTRSELHMPETWTIDMPVIELLLQP